MAMMYQQPARMALPQQGTCRARSFAMPPSSSFAISHPVSGRSGHAMARRVSQSPTTSHRAAPASGFGSDLRQAMKPGDVLCISGNGRLAQLGSAGGFLGHVIVVIGQPRRVELGSEDHREIRAVWPRGQREPQVWKVPALESTRLRSGLNVSEVILHFEPGSGRLTMIGELVTLGENEVHLGIVEAEAVELWQSPAPFRGGLQMGLVRAVLGEMLATGESWSYATAAQALFYRSAELDVEGTHPIELMELVCESWEAPPICTSIVVSFWQRYARKLAFRKGDSELDLILQCMPLRADRSLPGELLSTMESCGWTRFACLPTKHRTRCAL